MLAFLLLILHQVVYAGLSFLYTLLSVVKICRVEDILVQGLVEGSVVLFHRARTVTVQPSGIISTSGMGMTRARFLFPVYAFHFFCN